MTGSGSFVTTSSAATAGWRPTPTSAPVSAGRADLGLAAAGHRARGRGRPPRLRPSGPGAGAGVDPRQGAWRQAAAEIEQYRRSYQITDPHRALGVDQRDPTQRADRERVRTAIERVQAKQRATDRIRDRQPTSEHPTQSGSREQRGRPGSERAAG
jgi:hypothetical protein